MRFLAIAMLLLAATTGQAQSPVSAANKVYAVVFQVTVNASGKVDTLKVVEVLDPGSGNTNPVNVVVPQDYLTAARAFLAKRTYAADPKSFFTYTYYDPSQPTRTDIDPKSGHP